ncbi:MAG: tetratricopeptide repeat protein [Candidatus Hermodarchaeota archaeon]
MLVIFLILSVIAGILHAILALFLIINKDKFIARLRDFRLIDKIIVIFLYSWSLLSVFISLLDYFGIFGDYSLPFPGLIIIFSSPIISLTCFGFTLLLWKLPQSKSFPSSPKVETKRFGEKKLLELLKVENIEGDGTEKHPFIITDSTIFPQDADVLSIRNIDVYILFKNCILKALKLKMCTNLIFQNCQFSGFLNLKNCDVITIQECVSEDLELHSSTKVIIKDSKIFRLRMEFSFLNEIKNCVITKIVKRHSPDNLLDIKGGIEDKGKKSNVFINYYPVIILLFLALLITGNILYFFILLGVIEFLYLFVLIAIILTIILFIILLIRDTRILNKKIKKYYPPEILIRFQHTKLILGSILIVISIIIVDFVFTLSVLNSLVWNSQFSYIIILTSFFLSSIIISLGITIFLKNISSLRSKFIDTYNPLYPYFIIFNLFVISFLVYLGIGSHFELLNGMFFVIAPMLIILELIELLISVILYYKIKKIKQIPQKEREVSPSGYNNSLSIVLIIVALIFFYVCFSIVPSYVFLEGLLSYPLEALMIILVITLSFILGIIGFLKLSFLSKSASGYLYQMGEKYDKAIKTYKSELESEPNNDTVLSNLGIAHYKKGEYTQAKAAFVKALEINSELKVALVGLGIVYAELGEFDLALNSCRKAFDIKEKPTIATKISEIIAQAFDQSGDEYLWNALSFIYAKKGDFQQAIDATEKALAIKPRSKQIWSNLAAIYIKTGEYDKAIEASKKAMAIDKKYEHAWGHMGFAYHRKGNSEHAFELLSKANALNPKSPEIWYVLSKFYFELKQYDDAFNAVNTCLKFKSHFKEAIELREEIDKSRPKDMINNN